MEVSGSDLTLQLDSGILKPVEVYSPWPWSTAWHWTINDYTGCKQLFAPATTVVVGEDVTSQLISAFFLSWLDCCNWLLASLYHAPPSNHLQRVQNAAARLVLNLGLHDHVTPALKLLYSVHCMVTCRTQNQICLQVVYIYASNPHWTCITVYLVQSVQLIAESSRRPGLRSADTADYIKRRTRTKFVERCFSHAGPAAWNSSPDAIKQILNSFKNSSISPRVLTLLASWTVL